MSRGAWEFNFEDHSIDLDAFKDALLVSLALCSLGFALGPLLLKLNPCALFFIPLGVQRLGKCCLDDLVKPLRSILRIGNVVNWKRRVLSGP